MKNFLALLSLLVLAVAICYLGTATDNFLGNLSETEIRQIQGPSDMELKPGINPADTDYWSAMLPPPDENGMVPSP